MFSTFSRTNVLLATAACKFSTSDLQKMFPDLRPPVFLTFWIENVLLTTGACHFSTSDLQKALPDPQFFNILTWKRASPAIFRHRMFKKWSDTISFLTFWLVNALLATAACNFSASQVQKVLRTCRFLYMFTSKCASHHSDQVQKVLRSWRVLYILTWKCASRHSV